MTTFSVRQPLQCKIFRVRNATRFNNDILSETRQRNAFLKAIFSLFDERKHWQTDC